MWPDPLETADLVTFTEEILNGKLHFLCSVRSVWQTIYFSKHKFDNTWIWNRCILFYWVFFSLLSLTLSCRGPLSYRNQSIATSSLICSANQWTGFYMTTVSVMKELREREAISSQFNDDMYGEVRMYDQPYMKFICLKLLHQFWCSNYWIVSYFDMHYSLLLNRELFSQFVHDCLIVICIYFVS